MTGSGGGAARAGGVVVPAVPEVDLDLARYVRPGDTVVWGQASCEPLALTHALVAQRERVGPVRAFTVLTYDDVVAPDHRDRIRMVSIGAAGALGRLARAGALDVVPCGISALAGLFASGRLPCDVALVHVSPADADGWHRLGVGIEHMPACVERARVVLAEVNDRLPVMAGPYRLHASRITAVVRTSRPLVEVPSAPPTAVDRAIAAHVAGLVPDGAALQMGIGRLPDAVAAALSSVRGLRFHSGMVTDAAVDLVEAGAVDPGARHVLAAALGTGRLYRMLGEDRRFELHPYAATHDATTLAGVPRLVAVNSALEVDLTGQVGADRLDGVQVGLLGGQGDFLRGAARSPGGLPVVALPSTADRGRRSRIVDRIDSGVVTTPRSDVGLVVTEHGVADLRGRTLRERAEALVGVADPAFRDELSAAAARHV